MSTQIIVAIAGLGLFLLVAIAVAMQSIEKKRKENTRWLALLKARARNFDYMLNGFPNGFLGRDLQILVCKSLQDVYQQLSVLQPKDKTHRGSVETLSTQIATLGQSNSGTGVTLSDKSQIVEVQKRLKGLYSYIGQLSSAKRIAPAEAQAYAAQVKRLMLQTTVDGINGAITEALANGKILLALHNLKMVIEKLVKENGGGEHTAVINKYTLKVQELKQQLGSQDKKAEQRSDEQDAQWDSIGKDDDDTWKKKDLYD
jgi:hypothetical protein